MTLEFVHEKIRMLIDFMMDVLMLIVLSTLLFMLTAMIWYELFGLGGM